MELITQISCEVEEVLAHTKKELVDKIPSKVRNFFIQNSKDVTEYTAKYNSDIPLEQQDLLEETKGILALFYRDYWCSEEEKREIEKIWQENEQKYQEELKEKYNPDIFASSKTNERVKEEYQLQVIEELKWYEKLLQKIKLFFKK